MADPKIPDDVAQQLFDLQGAIDNASHKVENLKGDLKDAREHFDELTTRQSEIIRDAKAGPRLPYKTPEEADDGKAKA